MNESAKKVGSDLECMLFCNYVTSSQIYQKILPQRH